MTLSYFQDITEIYYAPNYAPKKEKPRKQCVYGAFSGERGNAKPQNSIFFHPLIFR